MAMKGYSALSKAPVLLGPLHQIVLCHIQDTRWESFIPLHRCSRCVLQPQPTGPADKSFDQKQAVGISFFFFFYKQAQQGTKINPQARKNKTSCRSVLPYPYSTLIIFKHICIWPIVGIQTGTTTLNDKGPGTNGKERVTLYSWNIQNWDFVNGCSFLS